MKKAQGFILVYDITTKGSLEELDAFYDQIQRVKEAYSTSNDDFARVVLANKCDSTDKFITKEEGEVYAKKYECELLEVSALKDINIKESFEVILKDLISRKNKNKKEVQSSKVKEVKEKKKGCIIL
jgi:GTPase KRas